MTGAAVLVFGLLFLLDAGIGLAKSGGYRALLRSLRDHGPLLRTLAAVMVAWGGVALAAACPPATGAEWVVAVLGGAFVAKGMTLFFADRVWQPIASGLAARPALWTARCAARGTLGLALAGWGVALM